VLGVRVADREHAIGALVVRSGVPRAFTAGEASFLQSMSSALGLAVGRREVETAARHQALHDALTGLPNRTLFLDRLESALARLERSRTTIAVLFLDLDHFKVVNDSLGHNSGDRILVTVAERLSSILRPGDTVARFGGDEFTILCDGLVDASEAVDIAERIRAGLATALEVGRAELHQTVSIGIAVATGLGAHPEAMLRDADAAMYRAKERGRNRVELFDDTMRDRAITRLRTEIALRRAITQDELVLHYQPVIDLTSGDMVGAEALIRWQHPREGLVAPARFIPVAEETGLISEISQWVLEHALQQVADWNRSADESTAVSLNVSARTLASRQFPDRVAEALEATGAPPELVCLEITESALMDDVERSLETLGRLRDLGVTLAVDDFGTGYSSLTYLKRLPVDVLKIDGSFVDGLGREAEDSAIVAAIVTLAATLGQQAIAEGVETALQLGELQRLGCPLAQGFLFSRAVPADDLSGLRHIDLSTATSVS
jgi:diguanylate cyclase (GGDEF)-like protein